MPKELVSLTKIKIYSLAKETLRVSASSNNYSDKEESKHLWYIILKTTCQYQIKTALLSRT